MAPYRRSTVDGVLPVRRLSSLPLALSGEKKARKSRARAWSGPGAGSHHRNHCARGATCACERCGFGVTTGERRAGAAWRRAGGGRWGTSSGGGVCVVPAQRRDLFARRAAAANDDVITAPRPAHRASLRTPLHRCQPHRATSYMSPPRAVSVGPGCYLNVLVNLDTCVIFKSSSHLPIST